MSNWLVVGKKSGKVRTLSRHKLKHSAMNSLHIFKNKGFTAYVRKAISKKAKRFSSKR